MNIRIALAALAVSAALVGCNKKQEVEVTVPAADQVDNTAQVEAEAAAANPTQEQIDQYNKDEAAMDDLSKARAEEAAKK